MKYGSLVLEKRDFVMIKRYEHLNHFIEDYTHKDLLETLDENMSNALIFNLEDMPDDIIRMYSTVTVSGPSDWSDTFQVVLPFENDDDNNKISVQSKLGASVIGLSEGDTIKHGIPGDFVVLKIEKVLHSEDQIKEDIPEAVFKKVLPKQYKNLLTLNI
ncbi:GreA/GreB family elongation factor [Aurantibacter crassamenti]|uniref:GreA/GreB family elongation factor n=1 Tax=Aurantibacter crassamenti TaxID=1837375 RepID=UPI001939C5D7|nr:GreA/GreB family elongation factor [Aurantibacter crassamenti]MBM1107641.1 GreA/GreB family elongation factor [Aurantibacter crassamenti]